MSVLHTNQDGLTVRYGGANIPSVGFTRATSVFGAVGQLVVDFTFDNLPGYDELDAGGDHGNADVFSGLQAFVPAGSYIESAYIVVTEEWDSAGNNSTLTIGTYQKDGTVIDLDGIDLAVTEAELAVNRAVDCNGAQVGGTVTVGAEDAYIVAVTANTPTAGAARLVVNYVTV